MAVLSDPHWEAVPDPLGDLLLFIGRQPFAERFYLAGGTALALRLGHRRSHDLDFFSATDEILANTREEIVAALDERQPQTLEDVDGNLLLLVEELSVGFFGYGYPLVGQPDTVDGVSVASVADVGLMKLDALISRGSRKDFYDLYFVGQEIPIANLLRLGETKYPRVRDFQLMAVEGMVQFENADRDVQPEMLHDVPWADVREFFIRQAKELGQRWFGNEGPNHQ